jgi:hypothetical protein
MEMHRCQRSLLDKSQLEVDPTMLSNIVRTSQEQLVVIGALVRSLRQEEQKVESQRCRKRKGRSKRHPHRESIENDLPEQILPKP